MTLNDREKRSLYLLGGAVVLVGIYWLTQLSSLPSAAAVAGQDPSDPATMQIALKRLESARRHAITTPSRVKVLNVIDEQLRQREKGLIRADTGAQAVAQVLQIARGVARNQPQPMALQPAETGSVRPFGDHYGEAAIAVTANCQIEQLLNFMAGITAQKELITTTSLQINAMDQNKKTISVRIGLSGIVPKNLVPKQNPAGFGL